MNGDVRRALDGAQRFAAAVGLLLQDSSAKEVPAEVRDEALQTDRWRRRARFLDDRDQLEIRTCDTRQASRMSPMTGISSRSG